MAEDEPKIGSTECPIVAMEPIQESKKLDEQGDFEDAQAGGRSVSTSSGTVLKNATTSISVAATSSPDAELQTNTTSSSSKANIPRLQSEDAAVTLSPSAGEAIAVTLLLSNWNMYGLSERVTYHFDLIETLTFASEQDVQLDEVSPHEIAPTPIGGRAGITWSMQEKAVCGVVSLLECVSVMPWNKMSKKHRRAFRNQVRVFNKQAEAVRNRAAVACHEPHHLPLQLSPSTRMSFAYEVTRIAFCVDASPSLTCVFGNMSDEFCCALDRLPKMVRTFFNSLVDPVAVSSIANTCFKPKLAVTVVAVYPRNTGQHETSVLVRDFTVHDAATANLLCDRITQWALRDVENEIASRMSGYGGIGIETGSGFSTTTSSLRDLLEAGGVALDLLPFEARPCIVVATDCRSVTCGGVLDHLADTRHVDVPLIVLDLSNTTSHSPMNSQLPANNSNYLLWDPGGPSTFPLHLSDDSEALHGICKATGGCFFDAELLDEASKTYVGQVPNDSILHADQYLSFRRRTIQPNALQWYILFTLSPLSPALNPSWGRLVPPNYIRQRQDLLKGMNDARIQEALKRTRFFTRATFSSYVLSPVRIKDLLLTRIKEGYRAKQYGQNTTDLDRVSIQFVLPMEFDTVLHYELSYKASSESTPMVGVAHIKVGLSGESMFIRSVKNDFLSNTQTRRTSTIARKMSSKLCKFLRGVRKEDCLQSYLSPLVDAFSLNDSPFLRRLGTLGQLQRDRYFRVDLFDILCVGSLLTAPTEGVMGDYIGQDNGEEELYSSVSEWSTETIIEEKRYVKEIASNQDNLTAYCIVEVTRFSSTSRLFRVSLESFGAISAKYRISLLTALKNIINSKKQVVVLPVLMDKFLASYRQNVNQNFHFSRTERLFANHYHEESWELVQDPEFLPLVTKRMTEIGNFWMLDSSETSALFVKFVPGDSKKDAVVAASDLHLVQYQVQICPERLEIKIYMDTQRGQFFPFLVLMPGCEPDVPTLFHKLVERVRARDKECGLALRSRTNLLSVFDGNDRGEWETPRYEEHIVSVERLLAYSSRETRKLRFFYPDSGSANGFLEQLTIQMLLSESFGIPVARLSIDCITSVGEVGPGVWFLIQYDRFTISLAHLALTEHKKISESDDENLPYVYQELTFFTLGLGDLYYAREGIDEVLAVDDHISENLYVTDFADRVEALHGENYSRAAYLALRSDSSSTVKVFDASDFAYALKFCKFVKVASIFLSQEIQQSKVGESTDKDSNLSRVVGNLLSPITCDENCLYYHGEECGEQELLQDDDDDMTLSEDASDEYEVGEDEEVDDAFFMSANVPHESIARSQRVQKDTDSNIKTHLVYPPLFVKFSSDDGFVSRRDISTLTNSTNLTVHISVFHQMGGDVDGVANPFKLPVPHCAAAIELSSGLNSYVAEQNLERLRYLGSSISNVDLKVVKTCLRKAHNAVSSVLPFEFYVSKSDTMVSASAPVGGGAEVDEGFSLLRKEFQKNEIEVKETTFGSFFVVDITDGDSTLAYWCFINIKRQTGIVSAEVYHPAGLEAATAVLYAMEQMIKQTCHRVNQILLLRNLHRSRYASSLLLLNDESPVSAVGAKDRPNRDGAFGCPIKFRIDFTLYQRCTAIQVVPKLEASVLHSFAVSNRQNYFVYRDETEAIFYMKLKAISGSTSESVELLVFGITNPGPSITKQLPRLLQKRAVTIAVDALSSVLTKNPYYSWKRSDTQFVRSFENVWKDLEQEHEQENSMDYDHKYELPAVAYDLLMILVYFRQNICGSTFFHHLQEANVDEDTSVIRNDSSQIVDSEYGKKGVPTAFDESDFCFFFNASPSNLNSTFQPVCTLTDKGREYSRMAGTGIAIIEVTLITRDGTPVTAIKSGALPEETDSLIKVPIDFVRCKRVNSSGRDGNENVHAAPYCIGVRIINTTLDRGILHSWVELCLNQVLVAWIIERHLERSYLRLLNTSHDIRGQIEEKIHSWSDLDNKAMIDNLCPGIPALMSIFESSCRLPHPAIQKIELSGMVQASSLAKQTIGMLENCILGTLLSDRRSSAISVEDHPELIVIRVSRSDKARLVNISRQSGHSEFTQRIEAEQIDSTAFRDTPIDCPEYLCFYSFHTYVPPDHARHISPLLSSMLFREVAIDDGTSDRKAGLLTENLSALKTIHPSVFSRSLAFVFSVRGNCRSLITYNWNPQQFKIVSSRLRETDLAYVSSIAHTMHLQQSRCLGILSPVTRSVAKVGSPSSPDSHGAQNQSSSSSNDDPSKHQVLKDAGSETNSGRPPGAHPGPKRKIKRPTFIRRPNLIGKSVEGAALQAVAASRARASAGRLKGHGIPVSNTTPKEKVVARQPLPKVENPAKALENKNLLPLPGATDTTTRRPGPEVDDSVTSHLLREFKADEVMIESSRYLPRMTQGGKVLKLMAHLWNETGCKLTPLAMELVLTQSFAIQSTTCNLVSLPPHAMKLFISSVGKSVAAATDCQVLALSGSSTQPNDVSNTTYLTRELKTFSRFRCIAVIRILILNRNTRMKPLVRCDTWIVTIPHLDIDKHSRKRRKAASLLERDVACIDKSLSVVLNNLVLETELFNFAASYIEYSVQTLEGSGLVASLLRELVERIPMKKQCRLRGLNFRVIQARLVPASFEDPTINMYDTITLFRHLLCDAGSYNFTQCGDSCICTKEKFTVLETKSHCFLTQSSESRTALQMIILCRTEGVNIDEYTMREGSQYAVLKREKILIEGARVVRDALRAAAMGIRRNSLWEGFTLSQQSIKLIALPNTNNFQELCRIASVAPLGGSVAELSILLFDEERTMETNWTLLSSCMREDPYFQPSWSFPVSDVADATLHVFFVKTIDVFLIFKIHSHGGRLLESSILSKEEHKSVESSNTNKIESAEMMFTNFYMHYVWKAL